MITTKTFETVARIPVCDRARGTAIHEPICDNPSLCGRYRLSRRKQIVDEYFGSVSDDETSAASQTMKKNRAPATMSPLLGPRINRTATLSN
jgi:hypothetical protein